MSRWVTPRIAAAAKRPGSQKPDGPLTRLAKYIPGEVVTAFSVFVAAFAALKLDRQQNLISAAVLFVVFEAATVAYIAQNTSGSVKRAHLLVGPIAFLAWAYQMASPLLADWFLPFVSLLAQAVVVALAIGVVPEE
jgi:hypothetical protein